MKKSHFFFSLRAKIQKIVLFFLNFHTNYQVSRLSKESNFTYKVDIHKKKYKEFF